MNREQVLKMFKEEIIPKESFKYFQKTYELCRDIREILVQSLLDGYIQLYKKINSTKKDPICFINAELLRTGVYSREYDLLISAYDKEWFFDKSPVYVSLNLKELFRYLDEFEEGMKLKVKRYVGAVSHVDVVVFKQEALEKYLHFITHIAREAVNRSIEGEAFKSLNRNEILNFYSGEYKGKFSLIKRVDDSFKDEVKIREEFESPDKDKRPEKDSSHSDFKGLNLKDMDFRFYNLSYSSFRGLKLTGSNLSGCSLCGCDFRESNLEEATITYSLICDGNFEGANLKKARFKKSIGEITGPEFEKQYIMGLFGTNFKNANLTETDFSECTLKGSDFRGGIFNNTIFKDADLKDAKFDRLNKWSLKLSTDQINSIEWV